MNDRVGWIPDLAPRPSDDKVAHITDVSVEL